LGFHEPSRCFRTSRRKLDVDQPLGLLGWSSYWWWLAGIIYDFVFIDENAHEQLPTTDY
jgi:hypothetical protein